MQNVLALVEWILDCERGREKRRTPSNLRSKGLEGGCAMRCDQLVPCVGVSTGSPLDTAKFNAT
jgi:hypothetical protein